MCRSAGPARGPGDRVVAALPWACPGLLGSARARPVRAAACSRWASARSADSLRACSCWAWRNHSGGEAGSAGPGGRGAVIARPPLFVRVVQLTDRAPGARQGALHRHRTRRSPASEDASAGSGLPAWPLGGRRSRRESAGRWPHRGSNSGSADEAAESARHELGALVGPDRVPGARSDSGSAEPAG